MDKKISNSFKLTAVINGKTIFARIKTTDASNGFFQFYDKSTDTHTPSWVDNGPAFFAECKDSEGNEYEAKNCVLHYIDQDISFDSSGLSVAGTFAAGTFKKTTMTKENSAGEEITYTVFQVVKEVFKNSSGTDSNMDDDDFYISGTVTLPGAYSQPFQTETESLTIVEAAAGGNMYYGKMDITDITNDTDRKGTAVARLFSTQTGTWMTEGVTYQFFDYNGTGGARQDITGTGNYSVSGNTLTVDADAVMGDSLIGCDIKVGGSTVYTAYGTMHDFTDPYYIDFDETGVITGDSSFVHKSGSIQEKETVTYTAKTVDSSGNKVTVTGLTLQFHVYKRKDGSLWTAKSTTTSTSFTYDEITATDVGGGVSGYITGTLSA